MNQAGRGHRNTAPFRQERYQHVLRRGRSTPPGVGAVHFVAKYRKHLRQDQRP
jgi:hypothetical protein